MKYSEEITAILTLAKSAGLTAYFNEVMDCVMVEMDWGDGETMLEPVYEYSTMMDLVGN